MNDLLNASYFGNSVKDYLIAIGIFLVIIIALQVFTKIFLQRIKKWSESTESRIDNFIIVGIERTLIPLLYFAAFYFSLASLKIPQNVNHYINIFFTIVFTFFFLKVLIAIFKYILIFYINKREDNESRQKQLKGILNLVAFFIWILGFVFLLDNLGFKVSAVITGLGIGGIAIALAAQAILGDLFSYFVIFFDKPFEIGDFIVLDNKSGAVENIGIKSTKIRSISGEQLIISNTTLTSSKLHNYKRMERRRVVFTIKVSFKTSSLLLKEIPELIKSIILRNPHIEVERVHFSAISDFSYNFEAAYFVLTSEYAEYMDIQQKINYDVIQEFETRGIKFAYPAQEINMVKEG